VVVVAVELEAQKIARFRRRRQVFCGGGGRVTAEAAGFRVAAAGVLRRRRGFRRRRQVFCDGGGFLGDGGSGSAAAAGLVIGGGGD
jgi:hypothetical protein